MCRMSWRPCDDCSFGKKTRKLKWNEKNEKIWSRNFDSDDVSQLVFITQSLNRKRTWTHLSTDGAATIAQNDLYDASTRLSCLPPLCLIYTSSGASNFCHVWPILPGCLSNFARLSDWFWDRNFPISPSNFVQCGNGQSDGYKNWTDGLAKSVGQQKSDQFWLFCAN
jgi:hypothetical protein